MIDSLAVLMQGFGRRAGNLKMATLASYFGLGQQKHRSLDDVRMNLEVLKHSATVLLLESSLPNILKNNEASPGGMVTRSKSSGKSCAEEASRKSPPITLLNVNHKSGPYTRSKLRKVTEGMKELLHGTPGQIQLNNLVKQSRSLLR
ncbi:hypothetical protein QJS04_geneDACA015173 [Acorus gramineus]|uniref:Exonuclease domain-containing protein n=1 Tax=Acorus gramineus TaxID=55184 RepID=A0AAV9BXR6_ACOGR|nr:hypothetical protein QJS04_geneDACA015173 [Acorus gramineus]